MIEDVRANSTRSWEFASTRAIAAQSRRRDFRLFLQAHGTADSDFDAAEIIFGELVANVVRHAPGAIRMSVEWPGVLPTLHVEDNGAGFVWQPTLPKNPLDECKRGLFIIQKLSADVQVRRGAFAGACVSVVLPVARRNKVDAEFT